MTPVTPVIPAATALGLCTGSIVLIICFSLLCVFVLSKRADEAAERLATQLELMERDEL
jgi:hypothetical protein